MLGTNIISKTPILSAENSTVQSKLEIIALLHMNTVTWHFKIADVALKHRNILDNTMVLYQKKTEAAQDIVSLTCTQVIFLLTSHSRSIYTTNT